MMTTCRSLATLMIVLFSLSTALAQTQPVNNQPTTPIITATASTDRVRYLAAGEVNHTRLQVFSADGSQVFDSTFKLGNLIDWGLVDQQGSALTDGSYLFLVTVRDFSNRLTQKYGTAILEQGQVYLEQTTRSELPQALSTALEANTQAETLSLVDRIGAAGLNRTASTDGTVSTPASAANTSSTTDSDATGGDKDLGGTGTQNQIAKWIDNAGNLGDSAVTEVSGNVGIGTITPSNKLHVTKDDVYTSLYGQLLLSGASDQSLRLALGYDTSNNFGWLQAYRNSVGLRPLSLNPHGGNVGVGTATPSNKLHVTKDDVYTSLYGQLLLSGATNPNLRLALGFDTTTEFGWFQAYKNGVGYNSLSFNPSGGNVGIGTTNPTAKLEVVGSLVKLPNNVSLGVGLQGNQVQFGSPNGETGMTIAGSSGRADLRFDGTLKLVAGPAGQIPPATNGIAINKTGNVGIGTDMVNLDYQGKLNVVSGANYALRALSSSSYGVEGVGIVGVHGRDVNGINKGIGVWGYSLAGQGVWGSTDIGTGVLGSGSINDIRSVGVYGSGGGSGVVGYSRTGTGLVARSTSGFLVEGYPSANDAVRKFHIDLNGTYTGGSDFAESLPALGDKSNYEPGDVVVMSTQTSGSVEKSRRPYDSRVAGVYSTRPGVLGADKDGATRVDPNEVPVAIVGIVPTKVSAENGFIRVGDLLTTSRTIGYAMRCDRRVKCIGAIVGKAMESMRKGKGVIKVLVTLR